jgi:hypothetical protein
LDGGSETKSTKPRNRDPSGRTGGTGIPVLTGAAEEVGAKPNEIREEVIDAARRRGDCERGHDRPSASNDLSICALFMLLTYRTRPDGDVFAITKNSIL